MSGSVVDRRYVVRREIARGAMGVVLEVQHVTLGTSIALKTLTAEALEWPSGAARLMREARTLALCRHDGIVAALDAGTCESHGPYLALEMLNGRSLESILLARHHLDVPQVTDVARQLCAAVACAHRHGVVHRDIKPANVIAVHDAGSELAALHLVDFGIAVLPKEHDAVPEKLTSTGQVLGTAEYIAPEHLLEGAPPSALSDVYSLGVMLYQCLVGDVPYPGRPTTILTALLAGVKPRPIRSARADVPADVEEAIMRAIHRDPAARLQSVDELADALTGRVVVPVADPPPVREGAARRQFTRVPYGAPVRIQTKNGPSDGRTEDISEGGVLVITSSTVEDGEVVTLKLPLPPSGKVVVLTATARWAKNQRGRHALGLAFGELPAGVLDDVRRYVAAMTTGRDAEGAPTDWGGPGLTRSAKLTRNDA